MIFLKAIRFYLILKVIKGALLALESSLEITENQGRNIALRHGYSSINAFQLYQKNEFNLYNSINIHYLKNSDWATNFGFGLRKENLYYDVGINMFYDTLLDQKTYHQLGFGGEIINQIGDIRCNLYLPLRHKNSTLEKTQFNYPGGVNVVCIQRQNAMSGLDIELGKQLFEKKFYMDFYGAFGGYGYLTKCHDHILGGRVRLNCSFWNVFKLGAMVTHDQVFKTSFQVSLSLSFYFGRNQRKEFTWQQNNHFFRQMLIVREPIFYSWKTNY